MSLEHSSCHTVLTLMFRVWKITEPFSDGAFKKKKKKDEGFVFFKVAIEWSHLFQIRGLISGKVGVHQD